MSRSFVIALLVSSSSGADYPAFLWSEKLDIGVGRNAQHLSQVTLDDLEHGLYAIQSGTLAGGPIALKQPASGAPEISVVFRIPGLETETVRKHAKTMVNMEHLLKMSASAVSVPFATGAGAKAPLQVVATVQGDKARAYLDSHPELFTNSAPDLVEIHMPKVHDASSLKAMDELVGTIINLASAKSGGNYLAMLTGQIGGGRRQLQAVAGPAPIKIERDLLTALLIGLFLLIIFISGFCCLFSLQTPRKFEDTSKAAAEH